VKELEPLAGWPYTEGSLVFRDRVATRTSTVLERLFGRGGAVPVGATTASEFGGMTSNVATQLRAASIVSRPSLQSPSPLHPPNVDPVAGTGLRITIDPGG